MSLEDENVERAVRRLLEATKQFTNAYQAWTVAPVPRQPEKKRALEAAERKLTETQHEVTEVQLFKRR